MSPKFTLPWYDLVDLNDAEVSRIRRDFYELEMIIRKINLNVGAPIVTIAAVDSPLGMRQQADYQCDGTNDELTITQAIQDQRYTTSSYNNTPGHQLRLLPGTFYLAAPIIIDNYMSIIGSGKSTVLKLMGSMEDFHGGVFGWFSGRFNRSVAISEGLFARFMVDGNGHNGAVFSHTVELPYLYTDITFVNCSPALAVGFRVPRVAIVNCTFVGRPDGQPQISTPPQGGLIAFCRFVDCNLPWSSSNFGTIVAFNQVVRTRGSAPAKLTIATTDHPLQPQSFIGNYFEDIMYDAVGNPAHRSYALMDTGATGKLRGGRWWMNTFVRRTLARTLAPTSLVRIWGTGGDPRHVSFQDNFAKGSGAPVVSEIENSAGLDFITASGNIS